MTIVAITLLICAVSSIGVLAYCCWRLNARIEHQRRLLNSVAVRHGHRIGRGLYDEISKELADD